MINVSHITIRCGQHSNLIQYDFNYLVFTPLFNIFTINNWSIDNRYNIHRLLVILYILYKMPVIKKFNGDLHRWQRIEIFLSRPKKKFTNQQKKKWAFWFDHFVLHFFKHSVWDICAFYYLLLNCIVCRFFYKVKHSYDCINMCYNLYNLYLTA